LDQKKRSTEGILHPQKLGGKHLKTRVLGPLGAETSLWGPTQNFFVCEDQKNTFGGGTIFNHNTLGTGVAQTLGVGGDQTFHREEQRYHR